jgi:hypothetical protein
MSIVALEECQALLHIRRRESFLRRLLLRSLRIGKIILAAIACSRDLIILLFII